MTSAIEHGLPKKQKAHGGISARGLISITLEVIGQCRRHQHNDVVEAPASISAPTGAAQPKPNGPSKPIIGYPLCDLKEISQMNCADCQINAPKAGKRRDGLQR